MILAAQVVAALWINRKGEDRDMATRGEITNNHDKNLRDDLDDKNRSVLDAIERLRRDMNGEFATVNERIANNESNVNELRRELHDLRRSEQ
nr:DUF2746 domain-containing protein [Bifidobacterium aerophilum]